jgi:hypothetical protein
MDLWIKTRTAQPNDVRRFAETVSTDAEFTKAVVSAYCKLQSDADDFQATVDRMPD